METITCYLGWFSIVLHNFQKYDYYESVLEAENWTVHLFLLGLFLTLLKLYAIIIIYFDWGMSMDNLENQDLDSVFVQELDSKSSWQCTPFLFFLYFLIFFSGYLSFTIANGVALFFETGIWQVPEEILVHSGKSHTWYPNFSWNNDCASMLHIFSCSTMIYYEFDQSRDHKSAFILGLLSIFTIYNAIKEQILGVSQFTCEALQTSAGISWMENIFVGIFSVQVLLTIVLLLARFILGISIIKLPETASNYQIAAYFFLPIAVPYGIQYYLYDSLALSSAEFQLILVGIGSIFLIQWERKRTSS